MSDPKNDISLLSRRAGDLGITLSRAQLDLFRIYLDELWDWNRRVNLVGVATRERVVTELFLDSLIAAGRLPSQGKILDIGSGAGIPGLPIKIHSPGLEMTLLEIRAKRVSFLKHAIRLMKLTDIEVLRARVEDLPEHAHHGGYHLVTARAFAGLDRLIPLGSPYLMPDGLLIGFSGQGAEEDLRKNQETIKEYGLIHHETIPYKLPGKEETRHLLILRKRTAR